MIRLTRRQFILERPLKILRVEKFGSMPLLSQHKSISLPPLKKLNSTNLNLILHPSYYMFSCDLQETYNEYLFCTSLYPELDNELIYFNFTGDILVKWKISIHEPGCQEIIVNKVMSM